LVDRSKIVLQGKVSDIRKAHTTHTYRVRSNSAIVAGDFEILTQTNDAGIFEYSIKKQPSASNNQLINDIIRQTEIQSFEEILPGMNDIFIQTVTRESL
jgi:ABC-2 type transport system ATP-binding protein